MEPRSLPSFLFVAMTGLGAFQHGWALLRQASPRPGDVRLGLIAVAAGSVGMALWVSVPVALCWRWA